MKKMEKLKSMKDFFVHDVSCVFAIVAIFVTNKNEFNWLHVKVGLTKMYMIISKSI